jgi:hypothetical protein
MNILEEHAKNKTVKGQNVKNDILNLVGISSLTGSVTFELSADLAMFMIVMIVKILNLS